MRWFAAVFMLLGVLSTNECRRAPRPTPHLRNSQKTRTHIRTHTHSLYLIRRVQEATVQEERLLKSGKYKNLQRSNVKLAATMMLRCVIALPHENNTDWECLHTRTIVFVYHVALD